MNLTVTTLTETTLTETTLTVTTLTETTLRFHLQENLMNNKYHYDTLNLFDLRVQH